MSSNEMLYGAVIVKDMFTSCIANYWLDNDVPVDGQVFEFRGATLTGNGVDDCQTLYIKHSEHILADGRVLLIKHPLFDYVRGDGKHSIPELIAMREKSAIEYIRTMLEASPDSRISHQN